MVTESLPLIYIGDMHFDHRRLYSLDGVPDTDGGVRVGGSVQDNAIVRKTRFLDRCL